MSEANDERWRMIAEIRARVDRLLGEKGDLSSRKREIETQLGTIKNRIRAGGRLDRKYYDEQIARQKKISMEKLNIEREISRINGELRDLYSKDQEIKSEAKAREQICGISETQVILWLSDLSALRTKYIQFSEDNTRVNSMRLMAAQFAAELDALINKTNTSMSSTPERTP